MLPANETIKGIDRLYFYDNSLIGIQTGRTVQRVGRLYLNAQLTRVGRLEVLDANNPLFDIPTTGSIVVNEFYFIGNSQMDKLNDNGTIRAGSDSSENSNFKIEPGHGQKSDRHALTRVLRLLGTKIDNQACRRVLSLVAHYEWQDRDA